MGNNRRNNKLKKLDSIQEKALKMALSFIVFTSQKFWGGHDIFLKRIRSWELNQTGF
jgi:hypothetical protein